MLNFVSRNPEGIAFLVSGIRTILNSLELNSVRHERLTMLTTATKDLAGRLPATPLSMAPSTLDEISRTQCTNTATAAGPPSCAGLCLPRSSWLKTPRKACKFAV